MPSAIVATYKIQMHLALARKQESIEFEPKTNCPFDYRTKSRMRQSGSRSVQIIIKNRI